MPQQREAPGAGPDVGWRERKKAKTRSRIQSCALRLFHEQGYEATTLDQITEAAEVSESTLYRFFPAKRDLVLNDDLDPLFLDAFEAQPAGVRAIHAIRAALGTIFAGLAEGDLAERRQRLTLVVSVPELRSTMLDQLAGATIWLAAAVARRTGRTPDDPEVRTLAGAVLGAATAVLLTLADHPDADLAADLDEALTRLANGFDI
ncbi:TetR family transcriptional regulator [Streptomyces sp. SID3343]|uniref:acyl-CoA-like ligand-binding transcription factor n=1 Tax=Streptomyces sp. SID3343 TaxID=2690260 RepID=UPI0013701536|nr:TetR family transcriptional regulator [Streptomyces sp. SID3343]MYV97855.1 TetR family transcriptional regulator [Streptomyces sp. SID3343]